jgi:hypothetical protein
MAPFRKRKNRKKLKKFIDYDKHNEIFYDNLYIDRYKIVVKIPLIKRKNGFSKKIKISEFDLGKYTYLLSYD